MASITTMNAQTIIMKVNEMLKTMLEDYYETIVNDVVTIIDKQNKDELTGDSNINYYKSCIEKSGLKEKIFNVDIEENVNVKIAPMTTHMIPSEATIRSMKRKDIQAMCKIHSIPGRQKNEELVQQLLSKRQAQIAEGKQPEPEPEPVKEKEIEEEAPDIIAPKIKKMKTKKPKKKEEVVVEKSEFAIEELDEDELPITMMFKNQCTMKDDEDEEIEEAVAVIANEEPIKEDDEEIEEEVLKIQKDELMEDDDDEEKDLAAAFDDDWDDKFFEGSDDEEDMQNATLDAEEYDDE